MNFDLEPGYIWLIGGVLLLCAELVAPGVFLVFVGAAAIITGLFVLLLEPSLPVQLGLFVVYSLLALGIGRKLYAAAPALDSGSELLNDRAAQLVGRHVTVIEAVDDHRGRVRVGDSEWNARGGPAAVGEMVRIRGVEGNCLLVEGPSSLPSR
jgi:inner membrane protein